MFPAAILFDFDGILVDTEGAIYEAWKETFKRYGKELPLEIYTQCIGSDFDTWSPKTHLEELTGEEFDWEEMDAARQVEIRAELEEYGPMEGVVDLLKEIQSRGIPMAVVSSSAHPWVDGWLEKLGMMSFFDRVICKGDAPRIKPQPDLYLAGAAALGVEAGGCLVLEDSKNGLIAASAAGMRTWIVPNRVTIGLDFSLADQVLADFAAVKNELFMG